MQIYQLRTSVFISKNIGYSPDVATEFKSMLSLDGQVRGLMIPGITISPMNSDAPQWGMPWCINKQEGNDTIYSINFLPGKIDFIINKEADCNGDTEEYFLFKCKNWISIICEKLKESVSRVAYAPSYAISSEEDIQCFWHKVFSIKTFGGSTPQDINISFNYKNEIKVFGKDIQVNLLCNISDGVKTVSNEKGETSYKIILIQLDLNSIPTANYNLSANDISSFFNEIIKVKDQLLSSIIG